VRARPITLSDDRWRRCRQQRQQQQLAFVRIRIVRISWYSRRESPRRLPMVGRFHPLAPCRPYHLSLHLPCPLFSRAMDGEGMGCAGGKSGLGNEREGERDRRPDLRSGLARLVSSLDRAPEHPRGAAHFFIPPIKRDPIPVCRIPWTATAEFAGSQMRERHLLSRFCRRCSLAQECQEGPSHAEFFIVLREPRI